MLENAMMLVSKSKRATRWAWATIVAAAAATGGSALTGGPAVAQVAPAAPTTPFDNPSLTALERGYTKPVQEPKLVFVKPGVISKVNVKDGDPVKAGQVLANQDDREEQAELKSLTGDIEGAKLQIEASQADLKLKKATLKRKLDVYGAGLAPGKSNSELDEAQAAVEVAEISIRYRQQELISSTLKRDAAKVRVEQKQLLSPINGIVSKVDIRVGEGSDISRPAIQVVANDTLFVETNVPATKAKTMKVGQPLQVRYQDEENWAQGKIVFMTPYADSRSGTRLVRLEMKNDGRREAGLNVFVQLPDATPAAPAAAAAAR